MQVYNGKITIDEVDMDIREWVRIGVEKICEYKNNPDRVISDIEALNIILGVAE